MDYVFEKVSFSRECVETLYHHLDTRISNISHIRGSVSYEDHVSFVLSNPYREWFLVKIGDRCIGNFYISFDNGIGINLVEEIPGCVMHITRFVMRNITPIPEKKSVVPAYFFVNVSSSNGFLIDELERLGGVMIQLTYKV